MRRVTRLEALLLSTLVGCALFSASVRANPINGKIQFTGSGTTDVPIPNATEFTSFFNVAVASGTQTGDYVGTDGTSVTMPGFIFDPDLSPDPVTQWSFTKDSITYSFDLYSPLTVDQGIGGANLPYLTLSGTGIAHITGYDETPGDWILTTQGSSATLAFSAFTTVPDGGLTLALLGCALMGVEGLRRRFLS